MLPNINIFSGSNIVNKRPKTKKDEKSNQWVKQYIIYIATYRRLYKSIEDKLNQQSKELAERAKVIAELKNSMSDINDKYNKLKIEFEKQKQYYIQLTINLRSQKRQLTNSINNNSTKNINFTDFQISHFSHIYQNKNPSKKKMKLKSDNNHNNSKELKKLKEEFANYKKDTTTEIENKNK